MGESARDHLHRRHDPKIDRKERSGECSVDEGAVDEEVYIVEVVTQDRYADGYRDGRYEDHVEYSLLLEDPEHLFPAP